MKPNKRIKIQSLTQLYDLLPEDQRIMMDVLRDLVKSALPDYCKEKISYNVPYFYGNKGISLIWPAKIPYGGIKKGVLLCLWNGFLLSDEDNFLESGTNKKIYYKVYESVDEINVKAVNKILAEAVLLDESFAKKQ